MDCQRRTQDIFPQGGEAKEGLLADIIAKVNKQTSLPLSD